MKKTFAIMLSLVMMLALSVSAFALNSPIGTKEYKVDCYLVDIIDGTTSELRTGTVTEGEETHLTVDSKYVNSFVKWDIDGEYEIVSGSLTSTDLVIRPSSDIKANLNIDPSLEGGFVIKNYVVSDIDGTNVYQWYEIVPEGDVIRLIVDDKYTNSFIKWQIDGEYEIVSGSLTSKELVIRPLGNIDAYAYVNEKSEDTDKPVTPGKKDDSPKSPDTSAAPVAGIVAVIALAGCTALVAKKRISK